MVKGLSADPWTIAKPLVFYLLIPLGIGIAIKRTSASFTDSIQPIVNKITLFDTIVMLVLCVVVYGKGFINAAGSYAFGTQILFFSIATIASYFLSFGLPQNQKSVLSLGMATRNIGAALAPLFALSTIDQRAIVMVAIGVPMQTLAGVLASRWLARRASAGEPEIVTT
jgi:BASS family bile acid:Na+ symporter